MGRWILLAGTLPGCLVRDDAAEERRAELRCAAALVDADGDGVPVLKDAKCPAPLVVDCDDADEAVYPGAEEVVGDGIDEDCDGRESCHVDGDGDGFGSEVATPGDLPCAAPGVAPSGGDCDDGDDDVFPGAGEKLCNDVDDDCDPASPDASEEVPGDGVDSDCDGTELCYVDQDGDGFGAAATEPSLVLSCAEAGLTRTAGDCDDALPAVHPSASESCNRRDDDCDGLVDDADPSVDPAGLTEVPADTDGDGFGDPANLVLGCFAPPGGVDCDDGDPSATIVQDWLGDADGDGVGAGPAYANQCADPGGGLAPASAGLDCDDQDPTRFPGQPEVCDDGVDQNCNTVADCDDPDCFGYGACPSGCVDEVFAPASLPASVAGSTVNAGNDDQVGNCGAYFIGATGLDYAYFFVPPVSGDIQLDLAGTLFDSVLYVRDACGGALLACNDDTYYQLWSALTFPATAGVPVVVVVDGYTSGPAYRGPFTLNAR